MTTATTEANDTRQWHVYYSKDKQREYYFDPVSQESTWVLPANSNRVTDCRNNNEGGGAPLWKLLLLGSFLLFSLGIVTCQFPYPIIVMKQADDQSVPAEQTIIEKLPAALQGNDSHAQQQQQQRSLYQNPSPIAGKGFGKRTPQNKELDQLAKNIEAALQSSEDLLKKIVADAKEAGMEIKSSSLTTTV